MFVVCNKRSLVSYFQITVSSVVWLLSWLLPDTGSLCLRRITSHKDLLHCSCYPMGSKWMRDYLENVFVTMYSVVPIDTIFNFPFFLNQKSYIQECTVFFLSQIAGECMCCFLIIFFMYVTYTCM